MERFRVTRTCEADYGHRIKKHDSKCKNVHGHRGKIEVTLEGQLATEGSSTDMVMDFGHIKQVIEKEIVSRLDHCFLIASTDTDMQEMFDTRDTSDVTTNGFGARYCVDGFGWVQELTDGAPTAEILAYVCYKVLRAALPESVTLVSIRFWETPTCVAEYCGQLKENR